MSPAPDLLERIRSSAAEADHTATLVPTHDEMVAHGWFHLLVPASLGGLDATIVDWFDVAETLAAADPSAGWLMAQGAMQSAWIAVAGSDQLVNEFFAVRQTLSSTSAGTVMAVRRGDHYQIRDARWSYASGSTGAAYLGGMIATTDADGTPETRMALVPTADAVITSNWDTLGLRATASHDIDFGDDVTIPIARTFTWPQLTIERPGALATAPTGGPPA